MGDRMWLLIGVLLASACFDNGGDRATTRAVCSRMLECGGWGWADQETCEDELLQSGDYDKECRRRASYLDCMTECTSLECDGVAPCEGGCWESACL